jgi:hypothetical protein
MQNHTELRKIINGKIRFYQKILVCMDYRCGKWCTLIGCSRHEWVYGVHRALHTTFQELKLSKQLAAVLYHTYPYYCSK